MINPAIETSIFQKAIEVVEALPLEDRAILVDIIAQRLREERRDLLLKTVAEAERDYAEGNVRRGSILDLMSELDN
ncbi:hypothetical protein [Merismopedia glauca]|uniref:Uncharacterized protein n=1 Tax=Merismopedia glauca CCAP 1448/3 TaxID=1296344 RepID=A0A2T1C8M3_9CYAN|nr:hypothetical protein [Merismopedia glauca]PSB04599.1 hypothetical protein C7B64_03350 [Merismopedia glauca CCAP 1448/3]